MSLRRVTGYVAECDQCGDDLTYVTTMADVLSEIADEDHFRRGNLVICWHCLSRRTCRIFGHWTGGYTCRRCGSRAVAS